MVFIHTKLSDESNIIINLDKVDFITEADDGSVLVSISSQGVGSFHLSKEIDMDEFLAIIQKAYDQVCVMNTGDLPRI